jgi:glutaminyl-tRNA synthetase
LSDPLRDEAMMTHSNSNEQATPEAHEAGVHFIHTRIKKEIAAGQVEQVITRFPPEPNGFLHLGHAKAIVLNFSMAETFGGHTNLRFDDTNPAKEEQRYIDAIKQDVQWLGYAWKHECYASDYFDTLYGYALHLIDAGLAYVDGQDAEVIKAQRGTLTEPGTPSPDRDRSEDENRDLFERMRAGEFEDGAYVLRAKIDMAAPNINLRDPILYRIRRQHHYRTDDRWCIYPTYDFTHGQSDAIEHITHSLCSLEFEDHRPLYDWFIEHLPVPAKPKQIEFARLNIDFTVLSKRRLTRLVDEGHVEGWDDPRMPTIAGLRRRGFTPEAIRHFCHEIGVTKAESVIPFGVLERNLRDDLNVRAERRMAVLKPLKVVLTNFDAGQTEHATLPNHPQDPSFGERQVPITQTLFIEQDDFMEDAPKKFFRLKPGGEVRRFTVHLILSLARGCLGPSARSKAPSTGSAPNTPYPLECICMTACLASRTRPATRRWTLSPTSIPTQWSVWMGPCLSPVWLIGPSTRLYNLSVWGILFKISIVYQVSQCSIGR